MNSFVRTVLSAVFPEKFTCDFCKREIFSGQRVCDKCREKLEPNDGPVCLKCGKPSAVFSEGCDFCSDRNFSFAAARSAFLFRGLAVKGLHEMKFRNGKYFAGFFADEMAKTYFKAGYKCDFATFVPETLRQKTVRGYNQSEQLALSLGERVGLEVRRTLVKLRETKSQVGLSIRGRIENLTGAFEVTADVRGARVLLVDDLLTTGTTADIVAKRLKKAGAGEVLVLTAATAPFRRDNFTELSQK